MGAEEQSTVIEDRKTASFRVNSIEKKIEFLSQFQISNFNFQRIYSWNEKHNYLLIMPNFKQKELV